MESTRILDSVRTTGMKISGGLVKFQNFSSHAGTVVIAAFITPLERDREMLRDILGQENIVEVFVNTSLEECERRDIKGLYKKARAGEIKNFTGISAPYERPRKAHIEINTEKESLKISVNKVISYILPKLKF